MNAIDRVYKTRGVKMAADKNGKKLPTGIRKKSENSYEIRVKHDNKTYYEYASTITEAKKKRVDLKYKLAHGTYIKPSAYTYGEWFEQWMKNYKKNTVKAGTYDTYLTYYDMCIKDVFGSVKLDKIKGVDIQRFYNNLLEKDYKISTLKVVKAILNSSFKQALRDGIIERNPVDATELPRAKVKTKKVVMPEKEKRIAMTREQQALFMEYSKDSYLYNYFAVSLRTGMRSGEARGLKYTDIDKKNGVIHVCRTLKFIDKQGYFEDTPKTKSSLRDIPLTDDLIELLENQRKFWGFKVEKIDRYLFCNEKGEALNRNRVQYEIDRISDLIRAAGHEFPRITSHVFRHTFATRAIEAGMPPQVLKTILGHSSLAMTMDLYSHVLPDTKAEEMQKIANMF